MEMATDPLTEEAVERFTQVDLDLLLWLFRFLRAIEDHVLNLLMEDSL
jgi:hypothetical protein